MSCKPHAGWACSWLQSVRVVARNNCVDCVAGSAVPTDCVRRSRIEAGDMADETWLT